MRQHQTIREQFRRCNARVSDIADDEVGGEAEVGRSPAGASPPPRARVLPVPLAVTAVRVVRSSTTRKRIGCPAGPSPTSSKGFT